MFTSPMGIILKVQLKKKKKEKIIIIIKQAKNC